MLIKEYMQNYRKKLRKELTSKTTEELQFLMSEFGYKPYDVRNKLLTCIINNTMALIPVGLLTLNSMLLKDEFAAYYGSRAIMERKIKSNPTFYASMLTIN